MTLLNAKGKPAVAKAVSIEEGSGHAIVTLTGSAAGVTDANGQATFTVVDLTAETVSFTATDSTDGDLAVPGLAKVVFTVGNGSNQCPPQTVTAARGYKLSTFASGFFDGNFNHVAGCGGIGEIAWSPSAQVYVPDYITGDIYKFGLSGGSPNGIAKITRVPLGPYMAGLAFGKNGDLYGDQWFNVQGGSDCCGFIYQLNPSDGSIEREVAAHVPATNIYVDPVSGDIFTTSSFNGGPDYSNNVYRIHDPGPGKPAADCKTGTGCSVYAVIGGPTGGITFDRDGTLYVGGAWQESANLWQVTGTKSAKPGTVALLDSTLVGGGSPVVLTPGDKRKLPVLAVNQNNEIDRLDLNHKPLAPVPIVHGPAGSQDLGPDGCLYVSNSNTISKLTTADGACPYPPAVTLGTGLSLAQSRIEASTGSSVSFSVHLSGLSKPAHRQVRFEVLGANSRVRIIFVDAKGNGVLTYAGLHPGVDGVTATTVVNGRTISSTSVFVRWRAGRHVTFTSLNLSPQEGRAGRRMTFTASLTDETVSPAAPLAGQLIDISLGLASCKALTNKIGVATCSLVLPSIAQTLTLRARFAGSGTYRSSSDSAPFSVVKGAKAIVITGRAVQSKAGVKFSWKVVSAPALSGFTLIATGSHHANVQVNSKLIPSHAAAGYSYTWKNVSWDVDHFLVDVRKGRNDRPAGAVHGVRAEWATVLKTTFANGRSVWSSLQDEAVLSGKPLRRCGRRP